MDRKIILDLLKQYDVFGCSKLITKDSIKTYNYQNAEVYDHLTNSIKNRPEFLFVLNFQRIFWDCKEKFNIKFDSHLYHFMKTVIFMFKELKPMFVFLPYLNREYLKFFFCQPSSGCFLISKDRQKVLTIKTRNGEKQDFPKGKVSLPYDFLRTAIEEVQEEAGLDVTHLIDPNRFCQYSIQGDTFKDLYKDVRMYIIEDIDEEYPFKAATKEYEDWDYEWIKIDDVDARKENFVITMRKFPFLFKQFPFSLRELVDKH